MAKPTAMIPAASIQDADASTLIHLVAGAREISVNFPQDALMKDVDDALKIVVDEYKLFHGATEQLEPIIGRILLTIKERKLWKEHYRNFTDYMHRRVVGELKFGRSHAWDALKIASAFPSIKQEQFAKYGATNLLRASAVTDESDPRCKKILARAARETTDQFRETVAEFAQKITKRSRQRPHVIAVRVDKTTFQHWKAIIKSQDQAVVFQAMISAYETHGKRKGPRSALALAS